MAIGISLHIGLNEVDTVNYDGSPWTLPSGENDASSMRDIADSQNFQWNLLMTDQATAQNVLDAIDQAANTLNSGDIFVLTYSGHGSQMYDERWNEYYDVWLLYDRMLTSHELFMRWARFKPGVRVFYITDSCFNGTMGSRSLPPYIGLTKMLVLPFHQEFIKHGLPILRATIKTSVLHFSACLDGQYANFDDSHGFFTETLLFLWSNGQFQQSYVKLYQDIVCCLGLLLGDTGRAYPPQVPGYESFGVPTWNFEGQIPFTI